jgi:hypothetical protein
VRHGREVVGGLPLEEEVETPAFTAKRAKKSDAQSRISEIVVLTRRLDEDILHRNTLLKPQLSMEG